ncbi:hypothetical protein [Allostreptomyces psammosilenae]|uniref:DUF4352 domain-containing protein n=1 Tax=Allostreptomyces psammosilenae TaxID=1892865 RepID=A0A853A263_9ACTN|nr:hypothetical protein [Allostreptomyces psammosilenae]NYI04528.1 hypothetical protein [Allostreptomyces psammosilenae]
MRRTVIGVVLAASLLAGCGGDAEAPAVPDAPAAPSPGVSGATTADSAPVPIGGTFVWPEGFEATATVVGELRPVGEEDGAEGDDGSDIAGGTVDAGLLAAARERLDEPSTPLGLRVELTNTGDVPRDLGQVRLDWVGVQVGGMSEPITDDGALTGELPPGESVTGLSAWLVPETVSAGYQVVVWLEDGYQGLAGKFAGSADLPQAPAEEPDGHQHEHGDHSAHQE